MTSNPLEPILDELTRGDSDAAERVFRTYEPLLRMVVRRQLSPSLRAKFDSIDIVQSVWADVLKGFREAGWKFKDASHLRAFLIRLTRHRFIDRLRQNQRLLDHERKLSDDEWHQVLAAATPEPFEVAQAEELWKQMLDHCPPEHREVLKLRREGALSPEIAAHTGLHEGSVRRILCNVARELAQRQTHDNTASESVS